MDARPGLETSGPRHAALRRAARPMPVVRTVADDARHVEPHDPRLARGRRWTAAGLALGSLAHLAAVASLLAAFGILGSVGRDAVLPLAAMVLPALLVGWCTGFASLSVLLRRDGLDPRLAGLFAAVLGCVLGLLVTPYRGML